jgi:AraC-like DNA-binding protein
MNNLVFAGWENVKDTITPQAYNGYKIICVSSSGEVKTNTSSTPFGRGDVVVIPPLVKHSVLTSKNELYVVIEQALLPVKQIKVIKGDGANSITETVKQAEYFFNGTFPKKDGIISALGELICAFVAAYAGGNGYSPVVETVMDDIQKNVSNTAYSLEDAMRSLPLNYDYIRKLFKKETGISPHDYLISARMERARSIMLSGVTNQYSNYTVSQIAEMCGFSEPLYFSRVFKNHFGVPPTKLMSTIVIASDDALNSVSKQLLEQNKTAYEKLGK